jgi:hypothetical protein
LLIAGEAILAPFLAAKAILAVLNQRVSFGGVIGDADQNVTRQLRLKECDMIGVFVKFHYGDNFDERAVRKIAETARVRFEGMPGLRSKAFTLNSGKREAANFYVWDSEDAAKAFFTDELLERVAGLYGVRPSVEFVQIATLVENSRS